jgi:hypothetical protein
MGRNSASGSVIRDEQPGSYFLELRNHFFGFFGVKILKFFDADPGSGRETVRIRDPGWEKVGSGIRDQHPASATLLLTVVAYSTGFCTLSYLILDSLYQIERIRYRIRSDRHPLCRTRIRILCRSGSISTTCVL